MNQTQQCLTTAVTAGASNQNVRQAHIAPLKGYCQIALKMLVNHPLGVLSNELRRECRTMNIAHQIRKLRLLNILIHCEMEEYRDEFGEVGSIGRYRLDPESYGLACRLLEV